MLIKRTFLVWTGLFVTASLHKQTLTVYNRPFNTVSLIYSPIHFLSEPDYGFELSHKVFLFETSTRPYATATAGCYCELQHFPQSLQSSQMLSVSSARLCLYIVCVNCLIPSLLPVFLSLSRWHPPPRCPPVTETRRPWIFSDRDSISPRCEAALRPGAPQKPTHTRTHPGAEHLGPVSAGHPQDPSGQSGDLRVHSGRAGPGSRSAGLPASPSVWGRKSRRGLAGAAVPRATHPLPRTVGTRFNWQNSTGQSVASLPKKDKLSQPFSSFFFLDRLLLECVQVWHVHKTTVTVLHTEESVAFLYQGTFCLIKSEQNLCHLHHLKVEKFKNARCFYPKTSDSFLHSCYIQPMWQKVGKVTLYFDGAFL